ncbi:MAG: ATP synthase F1 subunit gamma, partial [Patescibacteria group bacterium]
MNLRQVRKKIKSVTNVKKITKAMQLVSAVKMKKAQTIAVEGRPYRSKLEELFFRILPSIDPKQSPLLSSTTESKRELVVLISSNKGLAGAFNMNLFKLFIKNTDFKNTDFITLGKKGTVFVSIMGGNVLADFSSATPSSDVAAVFEMVIEKFLNKEYAKVYLSYNTFISTLRNEAVKEQLLPFELTHDEKKKEIAGDAEDTELEYLIEPDRTKLFEQLLINYLEEKIRGAVQNSEASEHSARMIAMKNATDNATDVIYSFTLL